MKTYYAVFHMLYYGDKTKSLIYSRAVGKIMTWDGEPNQRLARKIAKALNATRETRQ